MTIKHLYPNSRPTLDLKFAQDKTLDPRITFTRASSGTYVDENGVIQTAASNEARFDHDPETGESLGLLVEESSTNYDKNSAVLGQWSTTELSATPNQGIAPDGTFTASRYTITTANSDHYLLRNTGTNFGDPGLLGNNSISFFVKPGGHSKFVILFRGGNGNNWESRAAFDLTANTQTAVAVGRYIFGNPSSTNVEVFPNGWYRLTMNWNRSTNQSGGFYAFIPYDSLPSGFTSNTTTWGSYDFAGDGSSGFYLWGSQIERKTFPTSYIPTSSSTVTRAADVATVPSTGYYDIDDYTIVNQPFGTAGGSNTLEIIGPHAERTTVFPDELTQPIILNLAGQTDEFWRWRILGTSFALPNFTTDGQVTVDWGDGTVETLTTSAHTFTDNAWYHEIGFRLDSGTYFRPYINDNASHDTKVVALGPAPENMKLDGFAAFFGCSNLKAFDATIDATGGTSLASAWYNCSSLTSFPLIDTSSGTDFYQTWYGCSSLTSFPLIDTSSGTSFKLAWYGCSSLTSFPTIDTSSGTNFEGAWYNCSSLTSFPLINTSSGTNFSGAWRSCSSLTSFPLINTAAGTNFGRAWEACSSLTSFPLIDTSSGTNFYSTWVNCSSLTSFPSINIAAGTTFYSAWANCSSLTSFPSINTVAGTYFNGSWKNCSSLTDFPANFFDSWTGTPDIGCFVNAWDGCSSLTATSVENILNSIDTSGQSAPASSVDITIDYDAGTGTPSVSTAVTNLKSRGWTITLNGVAQ